MAASPTKVKIVLGCGTIGDKSSPLVKSDLHTVDGAQAFLNTFKKYGHNELDAARAYSPGAPGTCEPLVGKTDFKDWAIIASKAFPQPNLGREHVTSSVQKALEALKIPKLHIEYLHAMDRATPFEETAEAINEAYKAGKFEKFGLSNARPDEVDQFMDICEKNGWVKPSVYQGLYNAVSRLAEDELIPTLRKHSIQYYAYSPAAGGMFSGSTKGDSKKQGTRGDNDSRIGNMHSSMYHKDPLIEACHRVTEAAKEIGATGHAVALRWVLHHSILSGEHGGAIVIGASSVTQLEANLEACAAGPLPDHVAKLVDEVWLSAKDAAPPAFL